MSVELLERPAFGDVEPQRDVSQLSGDLGALGMGQVEVVPFGIEELTPYPITEPRAGKTDTGTVYIVDRTKVTDTNNDD